MHALKWRWYRRWFDRFAASRGRHSLRTVVGRHLAAPPAFSLAWV